MGKRAVESGRGSEPDCLDNEAKEEEDYGHGPLGEYWGGKKASKLITENRSLSNLIAVNILSSEPWLHATL